MKVSRIVTAGAAALVTCGVLGMAPAGGQAGSASAPTWTKQAPPVHPSARRNAVIAYDAATSNTVLFGGCCHPDGSSFGDTWTWDGTTWTQQHPATSPLVRYLASMTYDAATSTAVLFGGSSSSPNLADTWTWDDTTWTQQHPATSPPGRAAAAMAYDAAAGSAVLFGGATTASGPYLKGDTWTWG